MLCSCIFRICLGMSSKNCFPIKFLTPSCTGWKYRYRKIIIVVTESEYGVHKSFCRHLLPEGNTDPQNNYQSLPLSN